jgi:RNA polymerase sigma-70 factor (ECF subfamily)
MLTAEKLFDRRWALTLLDEVLLRLRAEHAADGKDTVFDSLKDFLTGENRGRPYEELSQALNMSTGALKVAIHRLRKRYRELLREEIGRTIHDPNGVEDEIQCLFRALS